MVDGPRSAVAVVSALPREYRLTVDERFILHVLACDSFDGREAAPSYDAIMQWTGLYKGRVLKALRSLCEATENRPALLQKASSTRGRQRTVWRLLVGQPVGQSDQSQPVAQPDQSIYQPVGQSDQSQPVGQPVGQPVAQPDQLPTLPFPPKDFRVESPIEGASDRPTDETSLAGQRSPSGARGTRLPDGWQPSPGLMAQMSLECPDVDLAAETRRFTDHWVAQPGQKGLKVDWDATWRNWVRRSRDFAPRKPWSRPTPDEQFTDILQRGQRLQALADQKAIA